MTVERDVFGLPTAAVEDNPEFAFLADNAEEKPEPEPTPEPATEPAAEPAAEEPPPPDPEGDVKATIEEGKEAEQARVYAGKYQNVEELEKGYKEIRDLQRRTAERAKAFEAQSETLTERARLLENTLRRAIPLLQQPRPSEGYDQGEQPGLTPQQITPLVDQIVSERFSQMQQGLQTQAVTDQAVREAERTIGDFYTRHPEVEVRGTLDNDITETINSLNEAWDRTGTAVDITDADALDIAYEAAKRPALRQVLELQPEYIDSDAGMELARMQAAFLEGQPITQNSQAVPASQVGQTVGQRKPVTESASTGATPPNADKPLDEFDQAVLAYRQASHANRPGGESVFF